MITEITTFELETDANLTDTSSSTTKILRNFLAAELAFPGAHQAYYGQDVEKPEVVFVLVNWDSIEDHEKFIGSTDHESQLKDLRSIMMTEKGFQMIHVPFTSPDKPAPVLGADGKSSKVGVTEIVFNYVPSTLLPADIDGIMASVDKMRPIMERSEALGVYDAWAVEKAVKNPAPHAFKGETSQVYVNMVGWTDIEAHERLQASDDYKQNLHHLLGIKEMRHNELYHVKLQTV